MNKKLRVIDPFFTLECGDILELSEDGSSYSISINEKFDCGDKSGKDMTSSYFGRFTISLDYAKCLLREGYLEPVEDEKQNSQFVNIFTEIDRLINEYETDLSNVDDSCKDMPACVRIEKTTVLENVLTLLKHLKGLKK